MASDEDYMAFLNKANQDPNEGYAEPQSSGQEFKTTDDGANIPAVIQEATKDAFYVSDADEPFVPVCLAWDEAGKGLPDEGMLVDSVQLPQPFFLSFFLCFYVSLIQKVTDTLLVLQRNLRRLSTIPILQTRKSKYKIRQTGIRKANTRPLLTP